MRALTLSLLCCAACGGPEDSDSGEKLPALFSLLEASTSETIPAVVLLHFEVQGGRGETRVEFGPQDGSFRYQAEASEQEDGSWRAVLVGCPPLSTCEYQLQRGDEADERRELETGEGPDWVDVLGEISGEELPGFLVTTSMSGTRGALIIDMQGRPVWWWTIPDFTGGGLTTRAHLAPDGQAVWFNQFDLGDTEPAHESNYRLFEIALDGSVERIHPLPDHHHDFHLLDEGGLAYIGVEDRDIEGELIRACRLVEWRDGAEIREIWNAWDHFEYDAERHEVEPPTYWTLANHLEPVDDGWIISLRNLDSVLGIDTEGRHQWMLGHEPGATPANPSFGGQHGLFRSDDSLLIFDNAGNPASSRVLEFPFGDSGPEPQARWEHRSSYQTLILGDVLRLDSGHTLVAYGQNGIIEEIDDEGTVYRTIRLEREGDTSPVGFLEYVDRVGPR